jgi:DNA-directed RNA polymerase specialized sigma24 family protein
MRKSEGKTVMTAKNSQSGRQGFELGDAGTPPADRQALDQLFSVTYEELRRLASSVRRGDPSATLSPTALVNEAWIKLAKSPDIATTSRLHFKRIAARAMRQLFLALNDALDSLARMNPRQAIMVESRFFGGLDVPETAALLNISEATVLRDWRAAKAWIAHELRQT